MQSASRNLTFASAVQQSMESSRRPATVQDPEIIECKTAIEALKGELDSLQKNLVDKDSIIESLQSQLKAKDRIIENYRKHSKPSIQGPPPNPSDNNTHTEDTDMSDTSLTPPTTTYNDREPRSQDDDMAETVKQTATDYNTS